MNKISLANEDGYPGVMSQAQTTPWRKLHEDPNAGLYIHDEVLVVLEHQVFKVTEFPTKPLTVDDDVGDNWIKNP